MAADLASGTQGTSTAKLPEKETAIAAIGATGVPRVALRLTALGDGKLMSARTERLVVIAWPEVGSGSPIAATGESAR